MVSLGVRILFLFIRGVDQTGRALSKPAKELTELEKRQQALSRSSYRMLFAGVAFLAFAVMAAGGIAKLLESTTRGQYILDSFGKVFDRLKKSIAEQIVDMFGPTLEGWIKQLDKLSRDPTWSKVIAGITIGGVVGIGTVGPALIGFSLLTKIVSLFEKAGLISSITATKILGKAALAISVGVIVTLSIIAIKWALDVLGPEWKKGTDKLIKDVKAKGEDFVFISGLGAVPVNKNPYEQLTPTGRMLSGWSEPVFGAGLRTLFSAMGVTININNVNTKADIDDLGQVLGGALYDAYTQQSGNARVR